MAIAPTLVGLTPIQRARAKALALRDLFNALPSGQRAQFNWDGLTVQVLRGPEVLVDHTSFVVGLQVQARAQDVNGLLPPGADTYQVINVPILVPDGTFTPTVDPGTGETIQVPNFVERPIEALKIWLTESIKYNARTHGWAG